jgi:hypothetical protein
MNKQLPQGRRRYLAPVPRMWQCGCLYVAYVAYLVLFNKKQHFQFSSWLGRTLLAERALALMVGSGVMAYSCMNSCIVHPADPFSACGTHS